MIFRRTRRARSSTKHMLDKTIVNRNINHYANKMAKKDESHASRTNGHCNFPMQNERSSQKSRGYRHPHRPQSQNGDATLDATASSNRRPKRIKKKPVAEARDIQDDGQMDLDDHTDDEYDYATHDNCKDKKNAIARYLMEFNEENIHLGDLPSIDLDKIIVPGRNFRLFLTEVHSPFKFWFQLNDNAEAVDSLMDRLKSVI